MALLPEKLRDVFLAVQFLGWWLACAFGFLKIAAVCDGFKGKTIRTVLSGDSDSLWKFEGFKAASVLLQPGGCDTRFPGPY